MSGLLAAFAIGPREVVAVAGAGGKTTLVYRLAEEARRAGLRVLVTATTHMGTLPEAVTGPVLMDADGDPQPGLEHALRTVGRATLLGCRVRPDKLQGVRPERVDEFARCADLVLVEADGARGRSLKLPESHEPVVPVSTTLMVVVAALDILGQPLDERWVHRLDLVLAACGKQAGEAVGELDVVRVLCEPGGYPARVPRGARAGVFLNKAEGEPALRAARAIAARLSPPYGFVLAGSARSGEAHSCADQ